MLQSCLMVTCFLGSALSMEILHTFRDPENYSIQHIATHSTTGAVYIGSTNRLHRLTANLSLVQSAATGPREDNPECPPPILPCDKPKKAEESFTKGLVVDPTHDSVILCTSLFHGSCQILKHSNITSLLSYAQKPIVPNDKFSSCLMFLAPGADNKTSLYIGAEYSALGDQAYRDLVPSISSRETKSLEFVHRDADGGTRLNIKPEMRSQFQIKFVAGFSYNGFVYFITTQPKFFKSDEIVTRISRVCESDRYFRSYIEIPLECQDPSLPLAVAQAASRMDGDGLIVSFSPDSDKSSLCMYHLENINKVFAETVQNCYEGRGKVGPAHYQTVRTCSRTDQAVDLCARTTVSQAYPALEGAKGVESRSLIHLLDVKITSIRAVRESGQDMVHAGTSKGEIVKILLDKHQATELERLYLGVVDSVIEILNSHTPEKIYVLTSTKAYLLQTNHCEVKNTCEECMDGVDPLCGWCVMENRCTLKQACSTSAFKPSWLAAAKDKCLSFTEVDPSVISYQTLKEPAAKDKLLKFSLESVQLMPSRDTRLDCLYKAGDTQHRTTASISNDRHITCPLPQVDKLAQISQGNGE